MPARKKVVAKAKGGTRAAASKSTRGRAVATPAKQPVSKAAPRPAAKAAAKPVRIMPPLSASAAPPVIDVMEIDWALFGELSRALALKVARGSDPDMVIGIATAGVIPGATIAAILDVEFHSMIISRRYHSDTVRATPAVFGNVPAEVRGQHVLVVDETCDSGATLRLAVSALRNAGAADVRTAVSFRTGSFKPDYVGLETEAAIVLPWDREILVDGDLVINPEYADVIGIH